MASEAGSVACCLGLFVLSTPGDSKYVPSEAEGRMPMRWAVGGGVFAGDDFWGEIDLARSTKIAYQHMHPTHPNTLQHSSFRGENIKLFLSVSGFLARGAGRHACSNSDRSTFFNGGRERNNTCVRLSIPARLAWRSFFSCKIFSSSSRDRASSSSSRLSFSSSTERKKSETSSDMAVSETTPSAWHTTAMCNIKLN